MELIVEYGLIGLLVVILLLLYLMNLSLGLVEGWGWDSSLSIVIFLFIFFLAIFSIFDGILVQESTGPFIFNIAAGIALSVQFRRERELPSQGNSPVAACSCM